MNPTAEQDIRSRVEAVERLVAGYTHDHVGWLLALQAIAAVSAVRQVAASPNPSQSLMEWREWSRQIISNTNIPTSSNLVDAESFRDRAREKLDIFFEGITVAPRQ